MYPNLTNPKFIPHTQDFIFFSQLNLIRGGYDHKIFMEDLNDIQRMKYELIRSTNTS